MVQEYPQKINMRVKFNFTLPPNFRLICLVFSCDPAVVLQDYINGISLPKLLSVHPDDPLGQNMALFLSGTKSLDPLSVEKKVVKLLQTGYKKELKALTKLDVEQPELELKIRSHIDKWCTKTTELRKSLRSKGLDFKIVGNDH